MNCTLRATVHLPGTDGLGQTTITDTYADFGTIGRAAESSATIHGTLVTVGTAFSEVSGNTRQFVTMLSDLAVQAALLRKQSSEFVGRILAA